MPERHLGHSLGRFRVDALIATGGFAWVYKGYDPELDIPVAIKVLKPQFAGEASFEERFRFEASTAAKLRHPNIVRILAVGREEQAVYLVMDYLPTALDDRLRIMGTLPEPLLIRLGLEVSAALAFAHREGVIHRDIKTDNILFDAHGNAIVADFGIARAVTGYAAQTGTNMVVGTPQYFSPEQARGQALDGRADIYALGVTLFKAATGVLPFQGEDWYDIARQHVEEPPPKPRTLNPSLSRAFERIILKCLEKDPADRYPTGDDLHADLAQLYAQTASPDGETTAVLPAHAGGASAPTLTTRRAARSSLGPRAIGLALAAGVAVVVLAVTAVRHRSSGTATADTLPPTATPAAESSATAGGIALEGAGESAGTAAGAELRIVAPTFAEVRLDGRPVGRGTWRGSGLTPGEHRVSASVHSVPGCPSANAESVVRLRSDRPTELSLTPRPCGTVTLDLQKGARWSFASLPGGTEVAHGTAPTDSSAMLPAGTYLLRVMASYCAPYEGDVEVAADTTRHARVRLICGSASEPR